MEPRSAPCSGGFSLHAAVLIEAADRPGLERLLRYCARPDFASERLSWDGSDQPVRYRLTKPLPTGQTERARDPPELHAGFACAFDQSPVWDSNAAASDPSVHFDQTLN